MVPFLELGAVNALDAHAIHEAIAAVVEGGWYIMGERLAQFERAFATYCGAGHCVGVANGLDALSLSLRALGVGPGDEVIVPAHTFVASWLAVSHVGARPVPVECDAESFNITAAGIAAAIGPRTRAIMPVHLYGQPADLGAIVAVASAHEIPLIEDAAQAHGASWGGKRIGTQGDVQAWSFYPGKNLGALGDGGAVTCRDPDVADRLRALRNYGSRVKYHHDIIGYNSRLDELQAAVLQVKLMTLDAHNARRREIASRYLSGLDGCGLELPAVPNRVDPVWHLFVVRHSERDLLADRLKARGVATMIHYPVPPHLQPAYAHLGFGEGSFPVAEEMARAVLSLPIGPTMTDAQVEQVIAAVRACV